ncbi:hypothetical protein [Rhizobium sp. L1K21]|uniref:hypothetical protein n=1 Tax=Rhizobium sp. L1K21 TaxID=2954933 RepID=UPI0020932EE2|nr:hypothetical protein [Rhizobium sp. L1K21]MCO6185390.1 hypothetical protein [Rhizobium sp. L1K21]
MNEQSPTAAHYFQSMEAALDGLQRFLSMDTEVNRASRIMGPYVERLATSFACWRNRLGFMEQFRISRAESGFPVFQNLLELENDRKTAPERLSAIPAADLLREEMADFILRQKSFPSDLQARMAERLYLEEIGKGQLFSPFILPETVNVDVNTKTRRPAYGVRWATFDGSQMLPIIYALVTEDSSPKIADILVTKDGTLNEDVEIQLPVGGLLNPELAKPFDAFAEKNSAYGLSPLTIARNLDRDFADLHPKRLQRAILGPFYSAGITENNARVNDIISKVRKPENAWVLTWTVQEVFSKNEKPAKSGWFSSTPAEEEFHINTDDLEATRQGVSLYEKHALVPHDAYQALYAEGEADNIFAGYKVHVISGHNIVSQV